MKLFNVDTIEEGKEKIKSAAGDLFLRTEIVPVYESLGRVCADDIYSAIDVPGFLRSTVDGYAVVAKDTQGAGESIPAFLKSLGDVAMGESAIKPIRSGECMYVPTGGMLPPGADAMVMVEYCEPFGPNDIAVYSSVSTGRNTIRQGEDRKPGEITVKKGTVMRPQDIGALASCGVTEIPVYRPLDITVISTGDELVSPGDSLAPGKIYDINTYSVSASALQHGHNVVNKVVVRDDEDELKKTILAAMECSQIVCVSGGSSQGKKDMTSNIIDELSNPGVFTHGLALKPGKPTILGYDSTSFTLMCGLPGHPVAAQLVFELVIMDAVSEVQGRKSQPYILAKMGTNIGCDAGKANCILVKLSDSEGGYIAVPILGKSGLISTLTEADGFVITGHNLEGIKENETVKVRLFK